MLALSLEPEEYITINGDIVVKIGKLSKHRCSLLIDAGKSVPIVRGEVLERGGNPPPPCMETVRKKTKRKYGVSVRWNAEQEQAMRILEKMVLRLERKGSGDEAKILRAQLRQFGPAAQEP